MGMLKLGRILFTLAVLASTGGCGAFVPGMGEIFDQSEGLMDAGGALERNIKTQIYCELKRAVVAVTEPGSPYYVEAFRKGRYYASLPDNWGVQLTLTLQVDENSALNPGAALTGLSPTLVGLDLGATLSTAATRIDKFTSFYLIKDLRRNLGKADRCFYDDSNPPQPRRFVAPGSSLLIRSDLRILEWLYGALHVEDTYKSQATDKDNDVYSYDVKFVVVSNGSANPTWKLVKVGISGNGSPLLAAGRSRSHDLLLTFGPTDKAKDGGRTLSASAASSHLASQIGTAVSNSLKGLRPQ